MDTIEPPTPDPASIAPPPPGWETTRDALHTLAEEVIAPARHAVDQRIRMRWLPGGFGTPVFGDGQQIRVEGAELVFVGDGASRREPLRVDPDAARWLGEFYAFVLAVLEDLRRHVTADEPVLWPEHFDYAIAAGDESARARANYGGSPGDEHHPEPYLYVGPWAAREGELWNATGFSGAELGLGELLGAEDPRALALEFFLTRAAALGATS
ncbi:MAG TPA: hypothetical protein VMY78_08070 [Solirubrobacteraceae bacterium]|nr:hypothetical protein [Solirubrobacteraceae bacterium]